MNKGIKLKYVENTLILNALQLKHRKLKQGFIASHWLDQDGIGKFLCNCDQVNS